MSIHEQDPLRRTDKDILVPMAHDPNENWCGMVNDLYGERGYRTSTMSNGYLRQRLDEQGNGLPHQYDIIFFEDEQGDTETRFIGGTLLKTLMGRDFTDQGFTPAEIPFASLVEPFDLELGLMLTKNPTQHILVPLSKVSHIPIRGDET